MRSNQISANGVDLFTESFGDPSDPTVLLIMGAMASAVWWPEEFCRRLDEVRVPALVIHGTENPVLPYARGVALAAALPRATLLTLKGTGHELHRDDWDAINDAVERHTA